MVRLLVIVMGLLLLCGCNSLRREVRTEERKDSVRVVKTEAVSIRERVALYVPTDSAGVLALLGLGGLVVPSCEAAAEGWADVGAKEGGAVMVEKKGGGGRAGDKPVGVVAVVEREIITSNSEDSVSIDELTTMEEEVRETPRGGLGCWWWWGAVVGLVLVAVMRR